MSDNLVILGTTYEDAEGFKATDSNGDTLTFTKSGGSATIDTELDATSTNAVQNKVIKEAIDTKEDKVTVCKARGTNASLSAGTSVTQVTLADVRINTDTSNYSISSGGIKVAKSGLYEVSGSTTITPNSATTTLGTYIKKGTAWSSAEEQIGCLQGLGETGQRSIPTGPVLMNIDANQIIFLGTRCRGTAGTCDTTNMSTFLQVKRIGDHT